MEMKIVDKHSPYINEKLDINRTVPIDSYLIERMMYVAAEKNLEFLAATQVGVRANLIIGNIKSDYVAMADPRFKVEDYSPVVIKIPRIHTERDYTIAYYNGIVCTYIDIESNNKERVLEMSGVKAALFQHSMELMQGDPPWVYRKFADW
jgi:peptide deformylase